MQWSERLIARAIALQTFQRRHLVLVPNCTWTGHECDLLVVTQDLRLIDVEVKISRADLKVDARKDKWWRHLSYSEAVAAGRPVQGRWSPWEHRVPREWPPKVWKHYYALPETVWREDMTELLASSASGLLLLSEQRGGGIVVRCERRAFPNRDAKPISPADAVDVARLASLRMWDAYAELERKKAA